MLDGAISEHEEKLNLLKQEIKSDKNKKDSIKKLCFTLIDNSVNIYMDYANKINEHKVAR